MFHSGQEFVLDNGILNTYCSLMELMAECITRRFRENADKCPNWRESAVIAFIALKSEPGGLIHNGLQFKAKD
nr:hypothetical protein BaRGS_003170 [Batillaria attramentaria]